MVSTIQTTPPPPFNIEDDPVPLRIDESGAVRVGNTRVLLEIVIQSFDMGQSPEEIVESFPTLDRADVYAIIAYYLRHREAVSAYVQWCEEEGERIRQQIEAIYPPSVALKERILARRAAQQGGEGDAASS